MQYLKDWFLHKDVQQTYAKSCMAASIAHLLCAKFTTLSDEKLPDYFHTLLETIIYSEIVHDDTAEACPEKTFNFLLPLLEYPKFQCETKKLQEHPMAFFVSQSGIDCEDGLVIENNSCHIMVTKNEIGLHDEICFKFDDKYYFFDPGEFNNRFRPVDDLGAELEYISFIGLAFEIKLNAEKVLEYLNSVLAKLQDKGFFKDLLDAKKDNDLYKTSFAQTFYFKSFVNALYDDFKEEVEYFSIDVFNYWFEEKNISEEKIAEIFEFLLEKEALVLCVNFLSAYLQSENLNTEKFGEFYLMLSLFDIERCGYFIADHKDSEAFKKHYERIAAFINEEVEVELKCTTPLLAGANCFFAAGSETLASASRDKATYNNLSSNIQP